MNLIVAFLFSFATAVGPLFASAASTSGYCSGAATPCSDVHNSATCTDGGGISTCATFRETCEVICERRGATDYNSPCRCRVSPSGCTQYEALGFSTCDSRITCEGFANCASLANYMDCEMTRGCEWTSVSSAEEDEGGEDEEGEPTTSTSASTTTTSTSVSETMTSMSVSTTEAITAVSTTSVGTEIHTTTTSTSMPPPDSESTSVTSTSSTISSATPDSSLSGPVKNDAAYGQARTVICWAAVATLGLLHWW